MFKLTLSQIKCHLITIYCFIFMIQSYYNINNAKTLRYINVCIWSTYEGTLYCAFKSCISCIFTVDPRILIRILCTKIRIRIRIYWKLESIRIRIRILAKWSDSDLDSIPLLPDSAHLWSLLRHVISKYRKLFRFWKLTWYYSHAEHLIAVLFWD